MNDRLPDSRIEKTIHSDIRLGHKVSFIGIDIQDPMDVPNILKFDLTTSTALFRLKKFQKALKPLVDSISPDIIHAHNIFFARAVIDFGYPIIYNDHEYWTKLEIVNHPFVVPWTREFLKKNLTWPYRYFIYRSWEKRILPNSVVITVHENIAKDHRKHSLDAFVMPNQPEKLEVSHVWEKALNHERPFDTCYIGWDMSRKSYTFRQAQSAYSLLVQKNISMIVIGDKQLRSFKSIESTGIVPHDEIYSHALKAKTGLLPWKLNPFHKYVDANKYYFYVHSGALPIIPSQIHPPMDNFSLRFNKIDEIPSLITQACNDHDPKEIIDFAKKHYLWETHDDQLKQAYEIALNKC